MAFTPKKLKGWENLQEHYQEAIRDQLRRSGLEPSTIPGNIYGSKLPAEVETDSGTRYECEADKPIGTRDVDKFLKEQQDELWRKD